MTSIKHLGKGKKKYSNSRIPSDTAILSKRYSAKDVHCNYSLTLTDDGLVRLDWITHHPKQGYYTPFIVGRVKDRIWQLRTDRRITQGIINDAHKLVKQSYRIDRSARPYLESDPIQPMSQPKKIKNRAKKSGIFRAEGY